MGGSCRGGVGCVMEGWGTSYRVEWAVKIFTE